MKHVSDFATEIQFLERIYHAMKQGGMEEKSMNSGIFSFPDKVVSSIEALLLTENRSKPWVIYGLAEIAIGVDDDFGSCKQKFIDYLFDAAEVGYVPAQLKLISLAGRNHLYPRGFDNQHDHELKSWSSEQHSAFNDDQRLHWIREAANNRSALAQYLLGWELIESTDPKAKADGIDWLWKARRGGSSDAAYDLAILIRQEATAISRQEESVFSLFEFAANSGKYEAMLEVGSAFERGIDVERDLRAALAWYEKAAALDEDGWAENTGEASYRAGLVGEMGVHTYQEECRVRRYFIKAAELGHIRACLEAAKILIKHVYFEYDSDLGDGLEYLERVAVSGNPDVEDRIAALRLLAEIHEDGRLRYRYEYLANEPYEWLDSATEYYRELLLVDVCADGSNKDYYRDRITRIQNTRKELLADDDLAEN